MSMVPEQLIAPLSVIGLGIFSFMIRWIAEFELEGAGADLALISSSLQLSLLFTRIGNTAEETLISVQMDILFFISLLIIWAISIKVVQKSLRSEQRLMRGHINPYSTLAFVLGGIALSIEIYWRMQNGYS